MTNLYPRIVLCCCLFAICACARYHGKSLDVTFGDANGVELRGSLVLPDEGSGPAPAVLLLHGAEQATRSFVYRMHANIFLERGFAVLLYDKRGAGESGGEHESATYAQLIDDALAAIDLLRVQPQVDTTRIGLVGASESGWLTPEIAERAGDLAFVINKVGPCLSFRETNNWEVYNDILEEGVSEASAREQAEVVRQLQSYYLSPDSKQRAALETTLAEWAGRDDSQLPITVGDPSPEAVQNLRYDPGPFLERLTTPTLYVYGSEDINVPTARCVDRLKELRDKGRPVSFHVFEGEGHELGGVGALGYRFADGYADLLGDFAESHAR